MSWQFSLDELLEIYDNTDKRESVEARHFVGLINEIKNLKLAFYELERLHYRQLEEEKRGV